MNDLENESIGSTIIIQTIWEDLGLSNDFLFGKVMQNSKFCGGNSFKSFPLFGVRVLWRQAVCG